MRAAAWCLLSSRIMQNSPLTSITPAQLANTVGGHHHHRGVFMNTTINNFYGAPAPVVSAPAPAQAETAVSVRVG